MKKIWVVIKREFLERVRTKWFILSTVLVPLLMVASVAAPILLAGKNERRTIAVLDVGTGDFGRKLTDALSKSGVVRASYVSSDLATMEETADSLAGMVDGEALDGFLIVGDGTVEDGRAEYRGANVSSITDMQLLEKFLQEFVLAERLTREGVDPAVVRRARIPVDLQTLKIKGGRATEESGEQSFILAYFMWLVLYVAILLYGVQVMGSVVEEKTSRIVEVLVSSLKPFQLMSGKVVGVGAVGLFQMGIWGVFGKLMLDHQDRLAGLFGLGPGAQSFELPDVPAATLIVFLSYFLMGYFLYAAMFAAVAAMSNSEAEARQAQTPVIMLLVIPTILMMGILNDPGGSLAVTLSVVPFTSPIAMPVRWAAAPVPLLELAGSFAALAGTLVGVTWVAARIYRVGILMYGKRPGPRELLRWVTTR